MLLKNSQQSAITRFSLLNLLTDSDAELCLIFFKMAKVVKNSIFRNWDRGNDKKGVVFPGNEKVEQFRPRETSKQKYISLWITFNWIPAASSVNHDRRTARSQVSSKACWLDASSPWSWTLHVCVIDFFALINWNQSGSGAFVIVTFLFALLDWYFLRFFSCWTW